MALILKNILQHNRGSVLFDTFEKRLKDVRERIGQACARARRTFEDVKIIAVSKTMSPDAVHEAADCGLAVFGESRVQEARQKIPLCPGHLSWHMIGHLQSNKALEAVRLFQVIHSVDSEKLLRFINRAGEAAGLVVPVCLEINVSGESSKFGITPEAAPALLNATNELMHVDVAGLMTIPPVTRDPADARPYFSRLRELRGRWRDETGFALSELSMGMSHDFEVAVEEGATWVRLGTILFGKRDM